MKRPHVVSTTDLSSHVDCAVYSDCGLGQALDPSECHGWHHLCPKPTAKMKPYQGCDVPDVEQPQATWYWPK